MVVKEVLAGDSVHSLLSILDVITVSAPAAGLAHTGLDSRSLGTKASSPHCGAALGAGGPLYGHEDLASPKRLLCRQGHGCSCPGLKGAEVLWPQAPSPEGPSWSCALTVALWASGLVWTLCPAFEAHSVGQTLRAHREHGPHSGSPPAACSVG